MATVTFAKCVRSPTLAKAKALFESHPMCGVCNEPASCLGSYESNEAWAYACDACCAHGNEDGRCFPLAEIPALFQRLVTRCAALEEEAARPPSRGTTAGATGSRVGSAIAVSRRIFAREKRSSTPGIDYAYGVGYRVPTVLRIGPYRFHFYAADGAEPPHVHVAGPYRGAPKFWLEPVGLADASGVAPKTLREIQRHVEENRNHLLRSWHEFFRA